MLCWIKTPAVGSPWCFILPKTPSVKLAASHTILDMEWKALSEPWQAYSLRHESQSALFSHDWAQQWNVKQQPLADYSTGLAARNAQVLAPALHLLFWESHLTSFIISLLWNGEVSCVTEESRGLLNWSYKWQVPTTTRVTPSFSCSSALWQVILCEIKSKDSQGRLVTSFLFSLEKNQNIELNLHKPPVPCGWH